MAVPHSLKAARRMAEGELLQDGRVEEVVVRLRMLQAAVVVEAGRPRSRRPCASVDGPVDCRDSRGSLAGCLHRAPTLACRPRSSRSGMSALHLLVIISRRRILAFTWPTHSAAPLAVVVGETVFCLCRDVPSLRYGVCV